MTSTYVPATALGRRIVDLLSADEGLAALLYEVEAKADSDDLRVWTVASQMDSDRVYALPRILVETLGRPYLTEQEDPEVLQQAVRVWVHTVAQQDQEELAERIDAYVMRLLLSTWLSDARIITPRLSADSDRRKVRVPQLGGAWQISSGYSTPHVGSLA